MALSDLPRFRGKDSYCPKCGSRGAGSQWILGRALADLCASPPIGFEPVPGMESGQQDLIQRECECGYEWWELPLDSPLLPDAPDLGETLEEENRALRRLIVAIHDDLGAVALSDSVQRGIDLVVGAAQDAEEAVAKAAPFFGPLRTEWEK